MSNRNRNDNINLNDHEILALAQISYIDWRYIGLDIVEMDVRTALEEVIRMMDDYRNYGYDHFPPRNGGLTPQDYRRFIEDLFANDRYSGLLNLQFTDYHNNRPSIETPLSDTLVMAALTDGRGNTIILSTGTEGAFDHHVTGSFDLFTPGWESNYLMGAGRGDAAIRRRVADFVRRNTSSEGEVLLLGHSRGFSLSLLGALYSQNSNTRVLGVQGFSGFFSLTPEERRRLELLGVINWAMQGDAVSHIGPEIGQTIIFAPRGYVYFWDEDEARMRRMTPEMMGAGFFHYLDAFRPDLAHGEADFMMQLFLQNLTSRLVVRDPSFIDNLLNILGGYSNTFAQEEQDRLGRLRYVVAGAKTKCNYGLRESKLLTPESKGVYIHDLPQLTEMHTKSENVICFGGCASLANPSTYEVMSELEEGARNLGNSLFGRLVRGVLNLKDRFLNSRHDTCVGRGYGECDFQTTLKWFAPKDNVFLEGEKALLRSSILPCLYGGTITIEDDGQKD